MSWTDAGEQAPKPKAITDAGVTFLDDPNENFSAGLGVESLSNAAALDGAVTTYELEIETGKSREQIDQELNGEAKPAAPVPYPALDKSQARAFLKPAISSVCNMSFAALDWQPALADSEAAALTDASIAVMEHYPEANFLSPKAAAWLALGMTALSIAAPRMQDKRARAAAVQPEPEAAE